MFLLTDASRIFPVLYYCLFLRAVLRGILCYAVCANVIKSTLARVACGESRRDGKEPRETEKTDLSFFSFLIFDGGSR